MQIKKDYTKMIEQFEKMEKEKALTDFDDPDIGRAWNSF